MKIPGPDHPITIDANPSRVVVKVGGKIIADTSDALTLREVSYPPVQYQAVHTGRSDRRDLAPWLCVLDLRITRGVRCVHRAIHAMMMQPITKIPLALLTFVMMTGAASAQQRTFYDTHGGTFSRAVRARQSGPLQRRDPRHAGRRRRARRLAASHTTPVRIAIIIHTGLVIYRCRPAVVDHRSSRCVGKTRNGAHDSALVGTHVPPVSVMHGSCVGSGTQSDQKAQGQNRTHRILSNPPATRTPCRTQAAPPNSRRDFTISSHQRHQHRAATCR